MLERNTQNWQTFYQRGRHEPIVRAPRSTRGPVCRVLLALYLIGYLIGAGSLSGYLWSHGGHATAEQWAYHILLVRLGISHHHDFDAETQSEGRDVPGSVVSLLRLSLPALSAPLAMPFVFGDALLIVAPVLPELVFPGVYRRLAAYAAQFRQGLRPAPPERPPTVCV